VPVKLTQRFVKQQVEDVGYTLLSVYTGANNNITDQKMIDDFYYEC